MMLIGEAEGHDVITFEGLAKNGELSAVQRAFAEVGAIQCGYCTPGMILSVEGLLRRNPDPTVEEIKRASAEISAAVRAISRLWRPYSMR